MAINLNIDKNVFLPVYYPYLFDYTNRYNVYYGGRSSGKTHFIVSKLLLKGLKEKRNILLMKKTTASVKDSVWKELLSAIDAFQLMPYFELNRSEFRATCKINGTEFHCIGLDISEKIKGYSEISDVYLDEATLFTAEDIDLIDGTLRSKKYELPLQMYFSFNPVGKANFIYHYFGFDTPEVERPNTFILHTTYLDNPHSEATAYMNNLKIRNYNRWKIEALGEWVSLDKLVYTNWEKKDFDYKELATKKGMTAINGVDFGFVADPSVIISSLLDEENKTIYVYNEWYQKGKTNPEIAQAIHTLGISKSVIIADSAESKSIEEIRRLDVPKIKPAVKGPDSVRAGIQKLQQYKLVIHPSCENTIVELENYAWCKDRQSGEYINRPQDTYNHCLDALRYSLQGADRQVKVIDANRLGL